MLRMKHLALAFLAACATTTPSRPPVATAAPQARTASLPTGWDGFYYGDRQAFEVLDIDGAAWVLISRYVSRVEPRVVDGAVDLGDKKLVPAWKMVWGDMTFEQLDDPLLRKLLARLRGEHVFMEIVENASRPPVRLTVRDGLTVAIDSGDKGCVSSLLLFDPTENASRPIDPHPKPPAAGETTARHFFLLETETKCGVPLPAKTEGRGLVADAFVHVTSDGEPVAFQLVGYMFSALFAAPGHTMRDLAPILERNRREVGRQAE